MSYIGEPFSYDLCVSYSHGDALGAGSSPLKRWSQAFIRQLEAELRSNPKFGRDLKLFFDQHDAPEQSLDPLAGLTDQLRKDIGGAALLTVLMSEHYLLSKWCAEERKWWCEQQDALGLSADQRVAIARIWPTMSDWPRSFVDERGEQLLGFWFYDRANAEFRPQPFAWPEPNDQSAGPFREQLIDLVGWLWRKIDDLKLRMGERRRLQVDAAKLAEPAGQVIYLHGRTEQAKAWERASEALANGGFAVLPGEPDPIEGDIRRSQEIRQRRVEALSACDALLLLGTEDSRALDADLVVVGRADRNSARALSNRFLPCGLLNMVGERIATPQRRHAARTLQVDWIDSGQTQWPGEVQRWLTTKGDAVERRL
jgi:hypothetical protein